MQLIYAGAVVGVSVQPSGDGTRIYRNVTVSEGGVLTQFPASPDGIEAAKKVLMKDGSWVVDLRSQQFGAKSVLVFNGVIPAK